MPSDTHLSAFPSNRMQALAFLYVQSQDLTGKTPADIQTMYFDALTELRQDYLAKVKSGYFMTREEG